MLLLYPAGDFKSKGILQIYIPLCFYFIGGEAGGNIEGYSFTFHYASTLSGLSMSSFVIGNSFTFHYASTLSDPGSHDRRRNPAFTFHYASTLSGKSILHRVRKDQFTFHYASTLSTNTHSITKSITNLHSTMLLLYRSWTR